MNILISTFWGEKIRGEDRVARAVEIIERLWTTNARRSTKA